MNKKNIIIHLQDLKNVNWLNLDCFYLHRLKNDKFQEMKLKHKTEHYFKDFKDFVNSRSHEEQVIFDLI